VLGGTERLNELVRRGQEVAGDEVRDEKREHERRRKHGTRKKSVTELGLYDNGLFRLQNWPINARSYLGTLGV
jgi:hypothetical protein